MRSPAAAKHRRLIAEVAQGRYSGRKCVLEPGENARIGGDVPATFVVPKDRKLSKVHFELRWDGEQATITDLKSVNGTLLAGESITTAAVPHASWIRAGATDFMVYHEDHSAPVSDEDDELLENTPDTAAKKQALVQRLRAFSTPVYALLDAARTRQIRILLQESVDRYQSLYDGLEGETLADAAPYLVRLRQDSALLDRLVTRGWGNRWGIFLASTRRFIDVRRHLRRFLMVINGESDERMYFRFYDPWVMDVFMRAATVEQRRAFEEVLTVIPTDEPELPMQWQARNDSGTGQTTNNNTSHG